MRIDGSRGALRSTLMWLMLLAALVCLGAGTALGFETACSCGEKLPSGALYEIVMPDVGNWNGDLIIYAHGYVSPEEPIAIPDDRIDDTPVSKIVTDLGYAYATTSYRRNGLVIADAVDDLVELVDCFRCTYMPGRVFLVGVSEGGLVAALATEKHPKKFDGGLAACGPVGDFRKQLNYFGDFLVVFNYFFPNVLPGCTPLSIPSDVIKNWDTYVPKVLAALSTSPGRTRQLLSVMDVPVDLSDPVSVGETVVDLLWYDVFATNDAITVLGGYPFDNRWRWYSGSNNDFLLNLRVKRYSASPAALSEIDARYQTSGRLVRPLVTLHTTGDPIVPYWHEPIYSLKTLLNGSALRHVNIPVSRLGHCTFNQTEALTGFALLVFMAGAW